MERQIIQMKKGLKKKKKSIFYTPRKKVSHAGLKLIDGEWK